MGHCIISAFPVRRSHSCMNLHSSSTCLHLLTHASLLWIRFHWHGWWSSYWPYLGCCLLIEAGAESVPYGCSGDKSNGSVIHQNMEIRSSFCLASFHFSVFQSLISVILVRLAFYYLNYSFTIHWLLHGWVPPAQFTSIIRSPFCFV